MEIIIGRARSADDAYIYTVCPGISRSPSSSCRLERGKTVSNAEAGDGQPRARPVEREASIPLQRGGNRETFDSTERNRDLSAEIIVQLKGAGHRGVAINLGAVEEDAASQGHRVRGRTYTWRERTCAPSSRGCTTRRGGMNQCLDGNKSIVDQPLSQREASTARGIDSTLEGYPLKDPRGGSSSRRALDRFA